MQSIPFEYLNILVVDVGLSLFTFVFGYFSSTLCFSFDDIKCIFAYGVRGTDNGVMVAL